jgi:hypothetical protein
MEGNQSIESMTLKAFLMNESTNTALAACFKGRILTFGASHNFLIVIMIYMTKEFSG